MCIFIALCMGKFNDFHTFIAVNNNNDYLSKYYMTVLTYTYVGKYMIIIKYGST